MTMTDSSPLARLVGRWTTEATHPALPGVVVHGTTVVDWLDGDRFLTLRARNEHPDFPDSLSLLGDMGHDRVAGHGRVVPTDAGPPRLQMHYYDSRGVFRVVEAAMDGATWRLWRDAPGFSQRFTGHLSDDGHTIAGQWQLSRDDVHWDDDLRITYRRQP